MAARRNPFELKRDHEEASDTPSTSDFLSYLPVAESRKKNRDWEKSHKPKHYRSVPRELREALRETAQALSVLVDDVARAFIEYSLDCVSKGTLTLAGKPKTQRMTLYPFEGAGWAVNGWTPKPPEVATRRKSNADEKKTWQEDVCYRIPDELHERVKKLAHDRYPIGEVVTVLLQNGLNDYQAGILLLKPQPKVQNLLEWGADSES